MSDGQRKKRANGECSPRQRANGLYEIRQMVDGERRSFYGKTPKEARAVLNRALRQAEQGRDFHAPRERVDAYLARWLTDVAALRVSERTLRGYREVVALHLAPALGRCWLDARSAADVQKMLTQKSRVGLWPRRVAQIRAVLRTALSDAERMAFVGRNVAKPVSPSAMPATKVRTLDADAAQAILDATAGDRYGTFYAVAVNTGLRAGEMA